jgi:hypothetical protein
MFHLNGEVANFMREQKAELRFRKGDWAARALINRGEGLFLAAALSRAVAAAGRQVDKKPQQLSPCNWATSRIWINTRLQKKKQQPTPL